MGDNTDAAHEPSAPAGHLPALCAGRNRIAAWRVSPKRVIPARMEWSDRGIVLSRRPHGETGLVTTLLTRQHGRHAGFVAGGISRKARPTRQSGNVAGVSRLAVTSI